jgi:hypothetical protein
LYSNHINRPDYWHKTVLPCLQQARHLQNTEKALVITQAPEFASAEEFYSHTLTVTENLVWSLWDMHKSWGGWLYWGSSMIYSETPCNASFGEAISYEFI